MLVKRMVSKREGKDRDKFGHKSLQDSCTVSTIRVCGQLLASLSAEGK